jgi:hypothetical protein
MGSINVTGVTAHTTHVFMSTNNAETWQQLATPPDGLDGLHYDDSANVLYGLVANRKINVTSVLVRMVDPLSGSGEWEDVTEGVPIPLENFTGPLTAQVIWQA